MASLSILKRVEAAFRIKFAPVSNWEPISCFSKRSGWRHVQFMRMVGSTDRSVSQTLPNLNATQTRWQRMEKGREERRTRRKSFLICPLSRPCDWATVFFFSCHAGAWCLWGVLVIFIVRWREGEGELMVFRSQLHGNSRHGHAYRGRYILRRL